MARTAPYVVFDQDSTMYLATGNACSSGKMPYVGCCAVHPVSKSNPEPIFPYGSYIQLQGSSVSILEGRHIRLLRWKIQVISASSVHCIG